VLKPLANYNSALYSGATVPKMYIASGGSLTVATHRFEFKPRQNGRIVGASLNAIFPNTMTVDFEIAGTDNIASPEALATGATTVLDAADFSAVEYAAGQELTMEVVVGTGAATNFMLVLYVEEQQGVSGQE